MLQGTNYAYFLGCKHSRWPHSDFKRARRSKSLSGPHKWFSSCRPALSTWTVDVQSLMLSICNIRRMGRSSRSQWLLPDPSEQVRSSNSAPYSFVCFCPGPCIYFGNTKKQTWPLSMGSLPGCNTQTCDSRWGVSAARGSSCTFFFV
jgi:hypothetical protein